MGKKFTISYQTVEEYNEQVKREYQERIDYYLRESITPTIVDENKTYTRKDKRQFNKWLKQKRKERIAAAKEWGPWDTCYVYWPLKETLIDMFEYYKNGVNVCGIPLMTDADGNIVQQDTRKQTLAQALALLEIAECEEDFGDYELSQQQFRIAFSYIAGHMNEWWD
jgi:hypothetical protein